MLSSILAGLVAFVVVAVILCGGEWLYHRLRHTKDWSPHWGTWAFAILAGLYTFANNLGR